MTVFGLVFGTLIPFAQIDQPATLAYSTEMSTSNLLAGTNAQRTSRGLAPLTINGQLNSSAASKAADMVARDYWAHNTPDGQEPWIFFDAAGYNYQKAGENLAYGFGTSSETITGWMNSPSHRDNMLDSEYTEVGFGFRNSPNFIGTGEETVIVAHYARPPGASAAAPAPPAPEPSVASVQQNQPAPDPAPQQPVEATPDPVVESPAEQEPEPETQPFSEDRVNQPVSTEAPIPTDRESQNITRLQQLTNGDAPWSAAVLAAGVFGVVIVWIIKHAVLVKRYLIYGEHFVAHHPLLDVAVVSIAAVAVYLSQTSGVVL